MRLIMLGTGPFAVPTLQALAASGRHEIPLVISRPPTGRAREASPLQKTGESLGLSIWTPDTVNKPESQSRIASLSADLLVVCDYGEILKPETLATTRLGGINLHGSLLPKYRGAAPVQWAILRGETETGNSVIQMTPGLDAGPLLGQERIPIDPDEDAEKLESRLAKNGAALVLSVVSDLEAGSAKPITQDAKSLCKAPRLKKEQGAVDWTRSAQEIKNQVRGLRPWPRAFTFLQRSGAAPLRINIDRVRIDAARDDASKTGAVEAPGTIIETHNRLLVATGDGAIELLDLQPAGKRSMSAAEFLRGYRPANGDRLSTD
jgi:methionyl-tRNA formyltransferase